MKKIFFLFLIVHCTLIIENCEAQWQWVNPTLNTSFIKFIKYADENTLYMTQENGNIFKSTDKGISWSLIKSDSSFIFRFIWFFNSNTGLITGYKDGKTSLIKTTNGGINWNQVFNSITSFVPSSIFFANNSTGYLGGTYSNLYRTTNAGNNWDSVGFLRDTLFNLSNIYFINANTGFITGWDGYQNQYWGRIFKTTNGGLNWTYTSTSSYPETLQFINDTGYVFCGPNLLKTVNQGVNWNPILLNVNQSIQDSKFINSQTGFIVGRTNSPIYSISITKTTNGGLNWHQTFPIGFYELYTIDNYGADNLITSGQGGTVVRSTDCGNNWTSNTFFSQSFCDIAFPNSNTGYVVSVNSFIKTTNGGLNWIVDSIPNSYNLNLQECSVKFFNGNTGFILKDSIYKTTNGGQNWNRINLGNTRTLRAFSFINENTGFAITTYSPYPNPTNAYLEKTTNSGLTWQETQYPNYIDVYKISFLDENTGYAYHQSSTNSFLKTTDGGMNWINITIIENLNKIYFLNSSKGFVFGQHGLFLTLNSGNNFTKVLIDSQSSGAGLCFIDSNTGYYLVNDYGSALLNSKIYKTTNGGFNWSQPCQVNKDAGFGFLYFKDINTGYVFGGIGAIMKTTNGGGFVDVKQISNNIPLKYLLFQNFPNPFNPATVIKFDVPVDSRIRGNDRVVLKVYDILGKEVKTLVNENLQAGTYEVTFNGSGFASGIYFYTLTAGDFKETKKLVLLK